MAKEEVHKENGKPYDVRFHYIKAQNFKVIHADGVIGNITPKGLIHFGLFSERPPFPQQVELTVNEDGSYQEKNLISKEGFIREIDVDVVMDVETAEGLKNWLEGILKEYKETFKNNA
jgi:hypothetical protein